LSWNSPKTLGRDSKCRPTVQRSCSEGSSARSLSQTEQTKCARVVLMRDFSVSPFWFCHAFEERFVLLCLYFATTLWECIAGYPIIPTYTINTHTNTKKMTKRSSTSWFLGKNVSREFKVEVNRERSHQRDNNKQWNF